MRDRRGVTLIELMVVIMIGGVLTGVAVGTFSTFQGRMGARGAQSALLSMHAQTRALAVEQAGRARLIVNPTTRIVSIDIQTDPLGTPTVVQRRDFGDEFNVTIASRTGEVILCMTPRGYADPNCNSFKDEARIVLSAGGRSRALAFLPLGQAIVP